MRHTILITGTAKVTGQNEPIIYELTIWGQHHGNPIQCITAKTFSLKGYDWLWPEIKPIVSKYYDEPKFEDGGYTTYLEHIIILH